MAKGGYMENGGEMPFVWKRKYGFSLGQKVICNGEVDEVVGFVTSDDEENYNMGYRLILKENGTQSLGSIEKYEKGGMMAKGGGIYSSENLYIVKVFDGKSGELLDMSRRVFAKNLSEAQRMAIEDFEYDMKAKYGDYLRFKVEEAPSMMAHGGKLSKKDFFKKYEENEDENMHTENVVLLAENYGTESDIRDAKTILAKHESIGHLPTSLRQERDALHDKLWSKYIQSREDGGMMAHGGSVGKIYYHILEYGDYGNIGYQGYYETEEEAKKEINRLSGYFPDMYYEIFTSDSTQEPPVTTMAKGGEINYLKKWRVKGINMQGKMFQKEITLGRMSDKNDVMYALKRMPDTNIREVTLIEEIKEDGGMMAKGGKLKIGGDDFSFLLELSDDELSKRLDLVRKQQNINGEQYFAAINKKESTQKIEDSRKNLDNQEKAIIEARLIKYDKRHKMAKGGMMADGGEISKESVLGVKDWFKDDNATNTRYIYKDNTISPIYYEKYTKKYDLSSKRGHGEKYKTLKEAKVAAYSEAKFGKMAKGGRLSRKQKQLDLNKNGKLDAQDFKMLRAGRKNARKK
jgi:hypothetical protein